MDRLFFEDLTVGDPVELGTYEMTETEIVAFAERWDPLPFHTDPAVATERHGGLIASGFHTLCVTARLAVEGFREQTAAGVGIGLDELRWHRPVRPGDTLAARLELLSKRPSESRPETGVVREAVEATVDGDPALTYETTALVERRGDESPGAGADDPEER